MDAARYAFALLILVTFPPAFLVWFLIHPFVSFWRKLGPGRTYAVLFPVMFVVGGALYWFREPLLETEYGTSWPLIGVAVPIAIASGVLRVQHRKHLTLRILAGIPELQPEGEPGKLLTQGIYARLRHPRYVEAAGGALAWALFANYLAPYLLVGALFIVIPIIVRLEERELRHRFGEAHAQYATRVPRFFPRLREPPDQASPRP